MKKKKLTDFKTVEQISVSQARQLKGGNPGGGSDLIVVLEEWPD